MVGALVGAVLVGSAATRSAPAGADQVVGCGSGNTATAADLQALQQAIVTFDATAGPNTITLTKNCTYSFTAAYSGGSLASWYGPAALPAIASHIIINGQGATIQRDPSPGTPDFRLFFVGADPTNSNTFGYTTPGAGNLTLQNVTLNNGIARGGDGSVVQADGGGAGMGGAIFNQGQLTLNRATIMGSTANGGNGSGLGEGGASGGQGGGIGPGTGFSAGFTGSGSTGGAGGPASQCCDQAGSGGGGGGFRSSESGANGGNSGTGGAAGPSTAQTGTGGIGGAVPAEASGGTGGDGSGGGGAAPSSSELLVAGGSGGAGGGFGSGGATGAIGTGVADSPWSPGGGGGGGGVGGGGGGGGAGESGNAVDGNIGGQGGAGGGGGFGGGGGSGGPGGQGTGDQTPLGSGYNGGNGGNGGAGGFGGGGGGGGAGGAGGVGATSTGSTGTAGAGAAGGFGAGAGTGGAFDFAGGGGGGAGMGGAVFNDQGQMTLDNATLSGNIAQGGLGASNPPFCCSGGDGQGLGGAVFNLNGTVATDSATIAFNTADNGGGIYNLGYSGTDGAHSYAAGVTLVNSIVARDTDGSGGPVTDVVSDGPATVSNGTANIASSNVNMGAGTPSHNIVMSSAALGNGTITGTVPISTDPWDAPVALSANVPSSPTPPFTPPDTLAIDTSSPAYNTGSTSLATDERGVPRPALGQDDIGAFEYTLITPTLTVQSQSTAGLGDQIQAEANLTGGSNFDGTVTFDLYGPGDTNCTGTPFFNSTSNVNNNSSGAQAVTFTTPAFTSFGTYSWKATYSGGLFYFGTTSSCGAPTVVVGKANTTIHAGAVSTANTPLAGAPYGTAFQDAVSVIGYNSPSGTITFNLYGPNDPNCTGSQVVFTDTETVVSSGAESTQFAASSATGAGDYHWIASYSGDSDNKPVSGACGDAGQTVAVTPAPSLDVEAIPATAGEGQALTATATLIGGIDGPGNAPPTGTVTFNLYPPGDLPLCNFSIFTQTVNLNPDGTATAGPFTPDLFQNQYAVQGEYSWEATYSGDANNPASVPPTCGAAGETVVVGKANPTLTGQATPAQAVPSQAVSDTVTLSGAVDPTSVVFFRLYGPFAPTATPDCTGSPAAVSSTNVQDFPPNASGQYVVNSATEEGAAHVGGEGTYYWVASYGGDPDDNAVATTCGAPGQTLTVAKATPSVTISQLIPSQVVVGNPVQAQATVSGASTGNLLFSVYGPVSPGTACDPNSLPGIQDALNPIDGNGSDGGEGIDGDGVYTSSAFTPTTPGTYFWEIQYQATNTFDNNTSEVCGPNGTLTVSPAGTTPQTITASASLTTTTWANTSLVTPSGFSGTGAITYSLDDGSDGNASDSVCQLTGATVSATGSGTCYVYASIAADTTYASATSADVAVTFTPAAQSITAMANPTTTSWANASTLSSSGTSGSGAITYSLDDGSHGNASDSVCQLTSTSLSATGPGACYVYATIAADANYQTATSADVAVTFTLLTQSISVSADPTTTTWVNTSSLSSFGTSGSGAITYFLDSGSNGHTSDPVCQLSDTTLSASGGGTCYVYATIAADSTYESATSADVALTFTQIGQTITASALPTSTSWANTSTVSSSGSSGTGAITYSLDAGSNGHNSSPVCQLSDTTVSATGAGTCYVYATIAADANYQSATSVDATVTFTQHAQTITASALPTSTSWANTSTVSSSGSSGTGAIAYSLDAGSNGQNSSSVCQLSDTTVSATGAGTCYVYATIAADANYQSATSADVAVTFTKAGQSITASALPTTTSWASTSTVSPSGYSGTGTITYTLDGGSNGNTSSPVCQLSDTTVSATGVGICYVYATIAADANYQSATSVDATVTFTQHAQTITASALPTSTSWANSSTVSSSGYSGTGAITYALDIGSNGHNSSPVCQLSDTTVSATGGGTCYVYASIATDSEYLGAKSADVPVTFTQVGQVISASATPTMISWANTSTVSPSGYSGTGAITYTLDAGSNGNTSSQVCQLSGATVAATGVGICYVYATIATDANYLTATSSDVAVTFTPAAQNISASASPTTTSWVNTSTVSSSGFSGTGPVTYTLDGGSNGNSSSSVCSLTNTTLSASGPGTCYVYATIGSDTNHLTATSADVAVTFTAVPDLSMTNEALNAPIVGIAGTPSGGYWLDASDGGVFSFGGAPFYGSLGGTQLNAPIVNIASTPDGGGYWLVGADGGVFSYGNAQFYGSTGAMTLNKPIVGMAPTPDGKGYWLVASDGGIFAYGDAQFYGSRGGQPLNAPIVGMAATPDGGGYWLVASDGGIFTYGDAGFDGSVGGLVLDKPIVGMTRTPDGNGYWLVGADGAVFAEGDAAFYGSAAGKGHTTPFVGLLLDPSGPGYRVVDANGTVLSFGP